MKYFLLKKIKGLVKAKELKIKLNEKQLYSECAWYLPGVVTVTLMSFV